MPLPTPRRDRIGRSSRGRAALGVTLALLAWNAAQPTAALAWTRAQVRGAQAHVEVIDAGTALIALRLRVRISGGWLSELDLPGLPPDIRIEAEKPVTLVADSGEKYVPEMVLRRGVWRLVFASKHQAPWRGDYTLTLLYRQALAGDSVGDGETQRAEWTMPPWRMGIEDARIWISGPAGMTPSASNETGEASSQHTQRLGGRVLITHHRTHLPRDTEWTVAFAVPRDKHQRDQSATRPTARPKPVHGVEGVSGLSQRSAGDWLPWIVLLLATLKSRSARALAARHRVTVRSLIPWPSIAARYTVAIGLAAGAHLLWAGQPWVAATLLAALVLLAIDRGFALPPAASLRWVALDASWPLPPRLTRVRAAVAFHRWLDATTPIGGLVLAGVLAGLWSASRWAPNQGPALALLAVLIAPLWVTSTQRHLPWQGARIGRALRQWCTRHEADLRQHHATTGTVLLCVDDGGRDRDARMPLTLDADVPGLHSLDLSLVTDARSLRKGVALLAQTAAGSAADTALLTLPLSVRRSHEGTAVHVVPTQHIVTALATLGGQAQVDTAASVPDRAAA